MDERAAIRAHLEAHGFQWVFDAGAGEEVCRDVIVYLDALEEGVSMEPPDLVVVTLLDHFDREVSDPVLAGPAPVVVSMHDGLKPGMPIHAYELRTLNRTLIHRFDRLQTPSDDGVTVCLQNGAVRVTGLRPVDRAVPGLQRPRLNLLGERERPGLLHRIRSVFRRR